MPASLSGVHSMGPQQQALVSDEARETEQLAAVGTIATVGPKRAKPRIRAMGFLMVMISVP